MVDKWLLAMTQKCCQWLLKYIMKCLTAGVACTLLALSVSINKISKKEKVLLHPFT